MPRSPLPVAWASCRGRLRPCILSERRSPLQSKRRSTGLRSRKTGAWPKAAPVVEENEILSRGTAGNHSSDHGYAGEAGIETPQRSLDPAAERIGEQAESPRRPGAPSLRHPPERGERRRRGWRARRAWWGRKRRLRPGGTIWPGISCGGVSAGAHIAAGLK